MSWGPSSSPPFVLSFLFLLACRGRKKPTRGVCRAQIAICHCIATSSSVSQNLTLVIFRVSWKGVERGSKESKGASSQGHALQKEVGRTPNGRFNASKAGVGSLFMSGFNNFWNFVYIPRKGCNNSSLTLSKWSSAHPCSYILWEMIVCIFLWNCWGSRASQMFSLSSSESCQNHFLLLDEYIFEKLCLSLNNSKADVVKDINWITVCEESWGQAKVCLARSGKKCRFSTWGGLLHIVFIHNVLQNDFPPPRPCFSGLNCVVASKVGHDAKALCLFQWLFLFLFFFKCF